MTATATNADTLDAKATKAITAAGWKAPTVVAEDATVRVVVASKSKTPHVLVVSPANVSPPIVRDGGAVGVAGAQVSATLGGPVTLKNVMTVVVSYDTDDAARTVHEEWIWLIRPKTLEIACVIKGNASRTPKQCGSGNSDSTTIEVVLAVAPTFDVTFDGAGRFSQPDPVNGGCLPRSPIRGPAKTVRYTIPAKGRCVTKAPTN